MRWSPPPPITHAAVAGRIEVYDIGPCIPKSDFGIIFQGIPTVRSSSSETHPGLGSELAIVQHLGVLLDNPVCARSREGKDGAVVSRLARRLGPTWTREDAPNRSKS